MIPPSIVLIMYGLITETSIHALFKAAFVPGFILAILYMVYIIIRTRITPSLAPLPEPSPDDMDGRTKAIYGAALIAGKRALAAWRAGKGMVAPLLIVFIVLGSIYGGVTGITEAAAMGAAAVLVLIILRGEFSFGLIHEALMRTFKSTGTIIWVTFGATALAGAYTISGGPTYVANLILGADLPTLGVLMTMMLIFLFMGAFMDWVGIVLLVMPVFLPIVMKLPIEEIGLFSPFGLAFCSA